MKVGELWAELHLEDFLIKESKRVDKEFARIVAGMDAQALLGLDATALAAEAKKAAGQVGEVADGDYTAELRGDGSGAESAARRARGLLDDVADGDYTAKVTGDVSGIDDKAAEGESSLLGMINRWALAAAGAAAAVGVLVGKVIVDGAGEVIERSKLNDKLAAQLGADSTFAADLGRDAADLWLAGYGDSIEQGGQVMRRALQNGLVPEDILDDELKRVSMKVMDIASTFDVGYEEITRSGGQLLRTGLAQSYDEALDIITRGLIQGGDAADDFLDTIKEYSTEFRTMGIDGATATGLLIQGLKAGARDADIVADAFKEIGIRLQSRDSEEAIKRIGLNYKQVLADYNKGGPQAAAALDLVLDKLREYEAATGDMATAFEIGGSQAEDMQDAFLALDPSSAVAALGDIAGASDSLSSTLNDNFGTKWNDALRNFDVGAMADKFAREGLPGLKTQLSEGVDQLKAIWEEYGPAVEELLGTAWDALQTWWDENGQSKIIDPATAWWNQTAQPAIGTAIGTALGAAWDAGFEWLKAKATDPSTWADMFALVASPASAAEAVVEALKGALGGAWDAAFAFVTESLPAGLASLFSVVTNWVTGTAAPTLRATLGSWAMAFLSWIGSPVSALPGQLESIAGTVLSFIGGLPGRIAGAASGMWSGIVSSFRSAINTVIGLWNGLRFPSFDIPSVNILGKEIGGGTFGGWDLPNMPMLATGAYVGANSPMAAIIGDGSTPEFVAPEPMLRQVIRDELANGNGGPRVSIAEQNIYEATDPYGFERRTLATIRLA